MNTQEDRDRLAREVKAARLRKFKTVDRARIAAAVSRGAWDNVERGDSVKDFTLASIEEALGWPEGRALAILSGEDGAPASAERGPGRLAELLEDYFRLNPHTTIARLAEMAGVSESTIRRWRAHAMTELPKPEVLPRVATAIDRSDRDVFYAVGVDTGYIVETVVEIPDADESSTA
ncbi:MAG: hypothetical protein ACJ72E_08485 [Marmoricola sp.]